MDVKKLVIKNNTKIMALTKKQKKKAKDIFHAFKQITKTEMQNTDADKEEYEQTIKECDELIKCME